MENFEHSADPSIWRDQDSNGADKFPFVSSGYKSELDVPEMYCQFAHDNLEKVLNDEIPCSTSHSNKSRHIHHQSYPLLMEPPSEQGHDEPFFNNAIDFPVLSSPFFKKPMDQNPSFPYTSWSEFVSKRIPINSDTQAESNGQRANLPCPKSCNLYQDSGELGFMYQSSEDFSIGGFQSSWPDSLSKNALLQSTLPLGASPTPAVPPGLPSSNYGVVSQLSSLHNYKRGSPSTIGSYSLCERNEHSCYVHNLSSCFENFNCFPFEGVRQEKCSSNFSYSCFIMPSERNKGPRAFRLRKGSMPSASSPSSNDLDDRISHISSAPCNYRDFTTDYKDAKFFVIKSYCEDNVHKSIKYGVWASTTNGNKKLDAAYREAQEKLEKCPVFFFFSVNASAQFCGIAEMVGPVNFDQSVDYWLQDKWSGHFPVRWHIIKDVPNSRFRHILLENNENKPVTNSRDTQEVAFEHGIEMLKIFKDYESRSSILEDFHFYEERQMAMQERKAKQLPASFICPERPNAASSPSSYPIKKLSKSFAEALLLKENAR